MSDAKSPEKETVESNQKKKTEDNEPKKTKQKESDTANLLQTSKEPGDTWLNEFIPDDKQGTTGTGEDGGQYTFDITDEDDNPF